MSRRPKSAFQNLRMAAAIGLTLLAGCGQGEYEKLISIRAEQLKNPHLHGILVWQEFESPDFRYAILMPRGEENVTTDESSEEITTETRDVTFGSTRYQVVCTRYATDTKPELLGQSVEEQYRRGGYVDLPEDESKDLLSPNRSIKSLNLTHPENGLARVEVVPLNARGIVTMAVLGAELDEQQCGKFFNSAKALTPSRRNRR